MKMLFLSVFLVNCSQDIYNLLNYNAKCVLDSENEFVIGNREVVVWFEPCLHMGHISQFRTALGFRIPYAALKLKGGLQRAIAALY